MGRHCDRCRSCRVGSLASGRETCLCMGSSWAWLALRRSPVPGTSLGPVTEAVSGPVSIACERPTLRLRVGLTRGRRVVDVSGSFFAARSARCRCLTHSCEGRRSRAIRGVGQLRRERRRWFLVAVCPHRRSASGTASASPASCFVDTDDNLWNPFLSFQDSRISPHIPSSDTPSNQTTSLVPRCVAVDCLLLSGDGHCDLCCECR
ncbi:hypothetical protein BD626DRAFT_120152 [Schizophyllum amplum]|uniref:Uncharacterized protein n=1 Tax=Schizophyllum amplum TaxID=97359 RepID=A0A550CVB8_9AGAR|nr:hypothetical protein BD626DRAFT_120152 [Auriculariopsis ampla]